jgi:hypothetical protein
MNWDLDLYDGVEDKPASKVVSIGIILAGISTIIISCYGFIYLGALLFGR